MTSSTTNFLCFELMTSLNSDEDVVKVMGADVPLAVQIQAFVKSELR